MGLERFRQIVECLHDSGRQSLVIDPDQEGREAHVHGRSPQPMLRARRLQLLHDGSCARVSGPDMRVKQ